MKKQKIIFLCSDCHTPLTATIKPGYIIVTKEERNERAEDERTIITDWDEKINKGKHLDEEYFKDSKRYSYLCSACGATSYDFQSPRNIKKTPKKASVSIHDYAYRQYAEFRAWCGDMSLD